ncbi:hypothetical protein [Nonomuraea polychroma]|uniref:hypothetical protein n=1 Tax=Nonomuraea polychroma TaxID=46176 RepID=UPI0013E2FFD9|nr:hypothetical protein [Nonomuraea polychroma]
MDVEEPIDIIALRRRFPWVALVSIDDPALAARRHREVMAEARRNREIVEAIDAARRSA